MRSIVPLVVFLSACGTVEGDDSADADSDTDTDSDTDADSDTASGEVPTCAEQYGDAGEYQSCTQESVRCVFHAALFGSTCDGICGDRGGECNAAFAAGADDACTLGLATGCDDFADRMICDCTRGCGGAPACEPGSDCIGDACL